MPKASKLRVVVVDDEPLARLCLLAMLENIEQVECVAEFAHGQALLDWLSEHSADVVLLDIEMPELNGLQVALQMRTFKRAPAIIFCTAFGRHALAAFGVNAVDYLLKPVRVEALQNALVKAEKHLKTQEDTAPLVAARTHIAANTHKGLKLIPVTSIVACLAEHKYVTVVHSAGETLIDEPLRDLEEEFSAIWIRAHRNALVAKSAIEYLQALPNGSHQLVLKNHSSPIPVSRRQLAEIRQQMKGLVV